MELGERLLDLREDRVEGLGEAVVDMAGARRPGRGGVVASVSQSRMLAGSVPRNAVMIMCSLVAVYAWVSCSGNGGVNALRW